MSTGDAGCVPTLVPVAAIAVRLGPSIDFGETRDGHRRVTPILGGALTWFGIGDADRGGAGVGAGGAGAASASHRLRGLCARILPGGVDRQLLRVDAATGDEIVEIDARYDAVAAGGTPIGIRASGVRRHPSGAGGVYFRVAVRFETADPALAALQSALFVADGARLADEVRHTVSLVS